VNFPKNFSWLETKNSLLLGARTNRRRLASAFSIKPMTPRTGAKLLAAASDEVPLAQKMGQFEY